jgi:hypothetical protein
LSESVFHSLAGESKIDEGPAQVGEPYELLIVKAKKTARIVCVNDNEFWVTQKQFWTWVREGLVDVTGQNPLSGRFGGKRERLLVMVRHVILDNGSPNHKQEVLDQYRKLKPHVSKKGPEENLPKKPPDR